MTTLPTRRLADAPRRRAFTLVELLVVLSLIGVLMLLGTVALVDALKLRGAVQEAEQRLLNRAALADQFRRDVASATATLDESGEDRSGPACLILQSAEGGPIVYRWIQNHIERSAGTGQDVHRQTLPLGPNCKEAVFSRSGPRRRLIMLELRDEIKPSGQERRTEIAAALGRDLQ